MSFVQERERRPNAGSRMSALLNQEIDMEELFEYNENEEDQEFSSHDAEEEEDKVDSDFDLDSSEGEQEHIEEGKEMDKQILLEEKRARRAATAFNPAKPIVKPKEPAEKKRKIPKSFLETSIDERNKRHSSRKNTILNRMFVEDQMREQQKRRAQQPKKDKKVEKKLTQEELLAEAALTEEKNKSSLLEWQQKEAEKKENARKKDKKGITGPFIRYHSFMDEYMQNPRVVIPSEDSEKKIDEEQVQTRNLILLDETMGRNLITFVEKESEEATDDLELYGLIDELKSWRQKAVKPNKPTLCPVTGAVAKYRDPKTNVPYANIHAYNTIKACFNHGMNWSPELGVYLGQLPSAKGVPEGWDSAL